MPIASVTHTVNSSTCHGHWTPKHSRGSEFSNIQLNINICVSQDDV